LSPIDSGSFSLAAAAFQKEERDDDKVTNRFYTFIEEKRRGYDGRVLAICLEVFVRADETCYRLRFRLWTEELWGKTGLVVLPDILYTSVILERHVIAEWDDALLEPRAGGRLRAVANGEQVGARVAPYPLGDELSDPVVHARHRFIGLGKVRCDCVERVSVRVEDRRVAWVVALEP